MLAPMTHLRPRPRSLVALAALLHALACGDDGAPAATDGGLGADAGPGLDGAMAGDAGGGGGADAGARLTALRVEPARVELDTDGASRARAPVRVLATLEDGASLDVTGAAQLSVDDRSIVELVGAELATRGVGGRTRLVARHQGLEAIADVRVQLRRDESLPVPAGGAALPADPAAVFTGATDEPSRAPTIVYPSDGVVLPANLGRLEIHFRRGRARDDLFAVKLSAEDAEVTLYARCERLGDGCLVELAGPAWAGLAGTARGLGPIELRVVGTDDAGGSAGTSRPIQLEIAATPVAGAIYYWTTSNGGSIMRTAFGATVPPERFYPFEGNTCHGCHALSPNGERMSVTVGGNGRAQLGVIDVGPRALLLAPSDAEQDHFHSWSPDSNRFAAVYSPPGRVDTRIRIRDGMTGLVEETIDVGVEPNHPDWSPRGDRILFTVVGFHFTTQQPGRGGLAYVEAMPGGGWGTPRMLLAPMDGVNRYYPAFAPDASFFLFNESTCPGGRVESEDCDADSDPSAKLWAMPADGGTAVLLARANAPGVEDRGNTDLTNSYPKWAPFVDPRRRDGSGRAMWMTFSSRRRYGLRAPPGTGTWLWMSAIDPEAVVAGRDGSAPGFALPFQDLSTSNHIAQWVGGIAPDPGGGGGQCLASGDPCDPSDDRCCAGASCGDQGGGIFRCRPDL